MDKKDPSKYINYDSSSETSSVGSDESLDEVGGPNFANFAKQLTFDKTNGLGSNSYFKPYDVAYTQSSEGTYLFPSTFLEKQEAPKGKDFAELYKPKSTDITTLFLVDSINRDRKAFPQPTSLSLKLPRIYKNVKSIQISQVKLLCSFYYFSRIKSNIYLPIIEKGRESITLFNGFPLSKVITIAEGTYGISDLLSEIQTEMNYTPVFYDFPNGFTDFIKLFTVNGDFSINFNQPGDSYYDRLNSKYIQNPTMAQILSYYWGSRYAGLLDYSIDQLKVAYYYPVLYELFLDTEDTTARPQLNTTIPSTFLENGETIYSHLIFNMSGINDAIALYLINQNLSLLDIYRVNHTFRYSLVNRYQLSYDTNSLRVNVITTSLNTSLMNLITNTGSAALSSILASLGLTAASYATIQANVGKSTVIYSDMFQFLQSILIKYLGIPFSKYAPQYFNNLSNTIYFQNGLNATGILQGYTLEYLTSGQTSLTSTFTNFSNSPGYWPNLNSLNRYQGFDKTKINSPNSLLPYSPYGKNFQFNFSAIDPDTYYFNTNETKGTVDIMVKILPAQYSVIKFRSSARQTLQVETLPLPYYYRYADYNRQGLYKGVLDPNKQNVPQTFFDLSYNFIDTNTRINSSNYSSVKLNPIFGQTFSDAVTTTYSANSQNNYFQFEFVAPYPSGISSGLVTNGLTISFVPALSTNFSDSFSAFVYHDRGVFMADLQFPRSENSLHYIKSKSVTSNDSELNIHLSTFSGHTYYTIFRSDTLACSNLVFKPIVHYPNSTFTVCQDNFSTFDPNANPFTPSNLSTIAYVTNYNTDFTRLPVTSSLLSPDSPIFDISLNIKGIPIGYDTLGVSNDLTDYMGYTYNQPGFTPNTQFRIDPLSKYTFQYNSDFDSVSGTYFNSTSQNSVLQPITNNRYTFSTISSSQVKIVHWYDGYSIPIQADNNFTTFTTIGIAPTSNITDSIQAYPQDQNGNIIFGRGISAIGFLPNDGVFEVNSFSFKSSIYPLNSNSTQFEDPNLKIKYIGVFSGDTLVNGIASLSTAITLLSFSKYVAYGPSTISSTPGFGVELGSWYTFNTTLSSTISGYTPLPTQLLNYFSMYYMVPFDIDGQILTYSLLSGSILPYPLAQTLSTGTTFYGNTSIPAPGTAPQPIYSMPVPIEGSNAYGPKGIFSQIQSQYEQSIPITTMSLGFKEIPFTVNDSNSPYTFSTFFQTQGIVTYFSEYSNTLFTVKSLTQTLSNAGMSFQSASYASSLSTVIGAGSLSSIEYLINPHVPLQNYSLTGTTVAYSTFTFDLMDNVNTNVTVKSIQLDSTMKNIKLWMWGGGGSTWSGASTLTGGAGAYAQIEIDVNTLLSCKTEDAPGGISTLYLVVGKGGNRDNFPIIETVGSLQLYEQPRYGGGGTTILQNFINSDSISLQGGGFSGIFASPNVLEATPLLVVGGGGAAGSLHLGGPGGFDSSLEFFSILTYPFSTVTYSGSTYIRKPIFSIIDPFTTATINSSTVQNCIDGNQVTLWNPSTLAKLNPSNFFPTPNTYGSILNFQTPIQNISKIRYYGPPVNNTSNLPTGFILYSDPTRSQVLYSNTSINYKDIQLIDNGQFIQQVFDIFPSAQINPAPIQKSVWLVAGSNLTPQSCIQYSLDNSTWVPTNNSLLTSVTGIVYSAVFKKWFAIGFTGTNDSIISSLDGITWTSSFTTTSLTTIVLGNSICVVGGNAGIFYSLDGENWTQANSLQVSRIRFINGLFIGIGGSFILRSIDGQTWTSLPSPGISGIHDITFGLGRYIIAQENNTPPYYFGLIFSTDLISWISVSQINTVGFSGKTIIFNNGLFLAGGYTSDSSFIKFSNDGINWYNTFLSSSGLSEVSDIQYTSTSFLAIAKPKTGTGRLSNQASVLTSSNGKSWSYSYSGGFDIDSGSIGYSSSYGPITVIPSLTSLYLEIQKTTPNSLKVYELRVYDLILPIIASTSGLIDSDSDTYFYPSEEQTKDVVEYQFVFTLPTNTINKLKITLPNIPSAFFTGLKISTDETGSTVIYTRVNISPDSFILDSSGNSVYEILFIPALESIETLYLTFYKITQGSLQLSEVSVSYDQNLDDPDPLFSTEKDIFTLDNKPINYIRIINGPYPSLQANLITGINIYSDIDKTSLLYSTTSPVISQYLLNSVISFYILPLKNYDSIYIEFLGNTPTINQVQFFTIGQLTNLPNGFSAARTFSAMNQTIHALDSIDGGGGSFEQGGVSGVGGHDGEYLTGGSPAISENPSLARGGGGGGYFGGGGGGIISNGNGGAGGGGSGFIFSTIFTLLDYGISVTDNFTSPGQEQRDFLINTNIINLGITPFGQGGIPSIDSGQGAHGLIVMSYEYDSFIDPDDSISSQPSFIDGSKLTLFQAPITYDTDQRNINFSTFTDSIQLTTHAGKNWVWYSSYLSLVGSSLPPSLYISSISTNFTNAISSFPSLPSTVFATLSQAASTICDAFSTEITTLKIDSIITRIQSAFNIFQSTFITITTSDTLYTDYTEVYSLLDYLRNSDNLAKPHVDPSNPTLDRILGGIPRFGYWANPFLVSASYVGFDVAPSQIPNSNLSTLIGNNEQNQSFYGLVLEMSLKTGAYEFKDVMAYKPREASIVTQFSEAYSVRSLSNSRFLDSIIPVQPYTFNNAITANLSLFKYTVYTSPSIINDSSYSIPIHVLQNFQGNSIYLYSFQNKILENQSTISITKVPLALTTLQMNQVAINNKESVLGTLVSENSNTTVQVITSFGFDGLNYIPRITYNSGSNDFYNTFSTGSVFQSSSVGKAIIDLYGNYFMTDNQGSTALYENIDSYTLTPKEFQLTNEPYYSPGYILGYFNSNAPYDFFESKYTNIWHVTMQGNIYGVRLSSQYDFSVLTNFTSQIFYPTHKITLTKLGTLQNPITNPGDTQTYSSFQHTQMFYYKNFSTMVSDISGQFAAERTTNFANADMFSGYGFNSYMYNIGLPKSTDFNNSNLDSFNYIAIRGYSPTETFQSLVRFYLPQRYDFGYISLEDLSSEIHNLSSLININPEYKSFLALFDSAFSTTQTYGAVGFPGFLGSNISTTGFANFLAQYNTLNTINSSNAAIVSTVTGQSNAAINALITGDLRNILPAYLANRNRTTDPIEFSIPFSTCVNPFNATVEQYGLGYNLGFALQDTPFTTFQRATSFFKILDDYIYLKLNEEFGMNKMDISKPENFAQTRDTTAQRGLYNSKLMLNTFGSFATTFVQSPAIFNPLIGKIETLSFNWYDSNGVLLNNNDCDWSATVQIVESVNTSS